MKNILFTITTLVFIALSYSQLTAQSTDFVKQYNIPETVAILPFEIYTFGKLPKDAREEMICELEDIESVSLQSDFYTQILASEDKQRSVTVQDYSLTNSILAENNISIRNSWEYSPEYLADLLKVDAVMLARVEKEIHFSNGLSATIEISQVLLSILAEEYYINNNSTNKNVNCDYALVRKDGEVIWSNNFSDTVNWRTRKKKLIERINANAADEFPYEGLLQN